MGITLDQLLYDATDGGAEVGSHVLAGDDGTAIGHVSDALKVNFSNTSIGVSATDLDIRDLAFATDKVDVSGSEVSLDATTLAALENITVSATDLDIRDIAHTQDSIKIGDGVEFLAINTDGSINTKFAAPSNPKTSVVSATSTAAEIAATPLTDRSRMLLVNNGTRTVYVGESNAVTTSNGIPIGRNASMELPYGAAANMWVITDSGTQNLRVMELD